MFNSSRREQRIMFMTGMMRGFVFWGNSLNT